MVLELIREHHDGVVGQGATNKGGHDFLTADIQSRAF
jgi:hypothetical protein